jgi:hypothetical protein
MGATRSWTKKQSNVNLFFALPGTDTPPAHGAKTSHAIVFARRHN